MDVVYVVCKFTKQYSDPIMVFEDQNKAYNTAYKLDEDIEDLNLCHHDVYTIELIK